MIFLIFLFSGLIIDSDQIKAGIKDIKATSIALFIIILSNCFAVVTIPLILPWMVADISLASDISIDRMAIFIKLLLLVLFTLIIWMLLKKGCLFINAKTKKNFGLLNQCIVFL